jgi:two-component system, sensor histidine kinase RegB
MRHVVAWLPTVRVVTSAALWTVLAASLMPHVDLPLGAIWPLILGAAICRTARLTSTRWLPRFDSTIWGISIAADVLLLTGLVDITGGPFNPFIVFYAVLIWLAAAALSPAWGGLIGAVAASAFGWLLVDHLQNLGAEHHRLNDFPTHLFTMWIAGAATAELVGHYMAVAAAAIADRQREVDQARARATHSEHLASLMTLAAGAAHELSTPLATIAVAARELERSAGRRTDPELADDARLIRTEVDRCRIILERMSGRAGNGVPDAPSPLALEDVARAAAAPLPEQQQRRLQVHVVHAALPALAAGTQVAQALNTLIRNAFDASDAGAEVSLRISRRESMIRCEVHDRGCGMSEEVRRRAGEPFYTTKEPGRGLGLGLFLARTFAERAGGALWFERHDGTTVAILEIPADPEAAVA